MYNVEFYEDKNGHESIIRILQEYGTRAGVPYVKNIEGELWELRPLKDGIFFFYYNENGTFILLHHFIKKTRKTPQKETDQAKRNLKEYKEMREK